MPSAVAPMVILETENDGLAAAKILGLIDKQIQEKVKKYQNTAKADLEKDDEDIQNG